jgi:hypothetical protein
MRFNIKSLIIFDDKKILPIKLNLLLRETTDIVQFVGARKANQINILKELLLYNLFPSIL